MGRGEVVTGNERGMKWWGGGGMECVEGWRDEQMLLRDCKCYS